MKYVKALTIQSWVTVVTFHKVTGWTFITFGDLVGTRFTTSDINMSENSVLECLTVILKVEIHF